MAIGKRHNLSDVTGFTDVLSRRSPDTLVITIALAEMPYRAVGSIPYVLSSNGPPCHAVGILYLIYK